MYKYRIPSDNSLRTEIEETVYEGDNIEEAKKAIMKLGDFKKANSYEKIRSVYLADDIEITLDIYTCGAWIEIEGKVDKIWEMASLLGFSKENAILKNADELYDDWCRKMGLDILWNVNFGLYNPDNLVYEKIRQ